MYMYVPQVTGCYNHDRIHLVIASSRAWFLHLMSTEVVRTLRISPDTDPSNQPDAAWCSGLKKLTETRYIICN